MTYTTNTKELITINIEIKPKNKIHEFFHTVHDKSEDILFSIIQKVPEAFIPAPIMEWLNKYIDRRTQEIDEELIRMQWQQVYLEEALEEIHEKQNKKKAP